MTDSTSPRPFAVVTGASSGIGRELANQFAQHGYDLLVTAEQPEITAVADDIRQRFAGEAIPVRADLSDYDGVEQLWGAINATGRTVDVVCLNAGRGAGGDFATGTRLEDELEVVDVNVRSTVHLAKRILPDMVARGRGRVVAEGHGAVRVVVDEGHRTPQRGGVHRHPVDPAVQLPCRRPRKAVQHRRGDTVCGGGHDQRTGHRVRVRHHVARDVSRQRRPLAGVLR
jgi:nucleoside-diphosphate-sugar epimerase